MNETPNEEYAAANAPSDRQQRIRSIEIMIRQTGNCDLLMELDQICMIADEQQRFAALLKLRESATKR